MGLEDQLHRPYDTQTGDATPTPGGDYPIPEDQLVFVDFNVIAYSNAGEGAWLHVRGLLRRNSAGQTVLVGSKMVEKRGDPTTTTWDADLTLPADEGVLRLTVTGEVGKVINWTVFGVLTGMDRPT